MRSSSSGISIEGSCCLFPWRRETHKDAPQGGRDRRPAATTSNCATVVVRCDDESRATDAMCGIARPACRGQDDWCRAKWAPARMKNASKQQRALLLQLDWNGKRFG